jgi:hypothetical protein
MTDLTTEQQDALKVAHHLADMGAPIFSAFRDSLTGDYVTMLPKNWQHTRPGQTSHNWIDRWRPGMALCMVTGVVFDVLDFDPRNGGDISALAGTAVTGIRTYGQQATPSDGNHWLIARTHLVKGSPVKGVDLQAGDDQGEGRGFIFLAPTVRTSKYGPNKGQDVAYRWEVEPEQQILIHGRGFDPALDALIELCQAKRAPRRTILAPTGDRTILDATVALDEDDLFEPAADVLTSEAADRIITEQCQRVRDAVPGEINSTLGGAARCLGRFVAGGHLEEEEAVAYLTDSIKDNPHHSDAWNLAHGKKWTAAGVITEGLARGALEPWEVQPIGAIVTADMVGGVAGQVYGAPSTETVDGAYPRLLVESAATMAYWLQQELGQGRLAGFFARSGQVVHTPRVSELGYVPAPETGDNGPAEIRPVTPDTLAAKLQFLYACYKLQKVKKDSPETIEVPAMFPLAAAKAVVNAPEALSGLRKLRGITHTPMVRADGSVLAEPGYDAATGYLYLPGEGVNVPAVPDEPSEVDLATAFNMVHRMIDGFPFATDEDRANYIGLLLTPLMRQITPPTYKMFGISAHQPGSGKSLLAHIAGIIHGSVLRSEVPDEEAEWRKMTSSILSTTSAPVVVLDNVTGQLRSSVLAGLLTAQGEIQERELGKSSNLSYVNDRLWVVTGNNMVLGGDLVRRTVTIMIDPDMANPEARTDFAIKDLPRWVAEHRNEILWSLLVLIRSWVVAGRDGPVRRQSDGFAAWERAVGGILAQAGVAGGFDQESGKRAAGGGDDDGLAQVLDHLWEKFGGSTWTSAQALAPDAGEMVFDSRDWLPVSTLAKLSRSEAEGRKSFGYWLRHRLGRWVTLDDGAQLVIRMDGKTRDGMTWRVDRREPPTS